MQIELGGGKRLIPLCRIQIMDPQILRIPEELATTPIAPPVTRSRARLQLEENAPV
jgi:hypothetical protein